MIAPMTPRSLFFAAGCLLLPVAVQAQSGDYEIAEIDAAASTFTGKMHGQLRTMRVRPAVEVTINGLKATFAELEPGMKVKVTSAEPGVATRLVASGLRTQKPGTSPQSGAATAPAIGAASQPARQVKANIPANSADAFPIGDVRKGTKISLQYKSGQWKSWGRISTSNPDDENTEGGEACRVVVSLPAQGGKGGEVLAIVPPDTRKRPFVFEAQADYPGLVLRINDKDHSFSGNPGSVEYTVKILPPSR
jgi:hypothetical protein